MTPSFPNSSAQPINISDREYFTIHRDHDSATVIVGKPVAGGFSGKVVIPITRRLNHGDGTFAGVVVALIEPSRFTDVLQNADMHPLDMLSLVGFDGITRARLVDGVTSSGQDVSTSPRFGELVKSTAGNLITKGLQDGITRLYSYRALKDYQLMAFVGRAQTDILAEFDQRRTRYFWAAGLVSAAICGFALLLTMGLSNERRAAADVVRSKGRFMAAFDQAAVGIAHSDLDGRYVAVNQMLCGILGYSASELLAKSLVDVTHPEDLEPGADFYRRLRANPSVPGTREWEARCICKDGSIVWCAIALSAVRDDAGKIEYVLAVISDISDRKRAEGDLRLRSARLQRLSRQLMRAQEQERRRLGRELHDRIGANLSASVLSLEVLRGSTSASSADSDARIDDCVSLLRETIVQVRDVLTDLRPPALDELGLFAALGFHVEITARRVDIEIVITGSEPSPRLTPEVEIALFRIAQEALNNAIRHSHATLITVALTHDAAHVTVAVSDNGNGFDAVPIVSATPSLGMLTMRERAEAVQGHLVTDSVPGGGARISVVVPRAARPE